MESRSESGNMRSNANLGYFMPIVYNPTLSAWIQENLLDSATFGGRFSRNIVLKELPLDLCLKFWRGKEKRTATRDLVDVLSVTGGVPRYLEEIDPALSAAENIRRMCFSEDGPLFKDFSAIFNEIFGETTLVKADILRMLSAGPATCSVLAERLGVGRGGSLSRNLQELCEAGFISKDEGLNPATLRPSKLARYRVSDNYTRFYLKYVEPHEAEIRSGRFAFSSLASLEGWQVDMGHQFENLVVNNVRRLVPHLHLEWGCVKSAAPFEIRGDRKGTRKGVQIDLLVQTQGMAILVEIKRRTRMGADVEAEMRRKLEVFPRRRNVSVRTALVYEGELDGSVTNGGVFDFVIPIEALLS